MALKRTHCITAAATIVLVGAVVAILLQLQPSRRPRARQAYYYRLADGAIITADDRTPPIDTPDGPAVRAVILSCDNCADQDARFTGWLETNPPETAALYVALDAAVDPQERSNIQSRIASLAQVAPPPQSAAPPAWAPMNSPAGVAIIRTARSRCPAAPQYCQPQDNSR